MPDRSTGLTLTSKTEAKERKQREIKGAPPALIFNSEPTIADAVKILSGFFTQPGMGIPSIISIFYFFEMGEAVKQDTIDELRAKLRKILENPANNKIVKEGVTLCDAAHHALLALTLYRPINEDDFTSDVIGNENRVVASDGYQFDIATLINWHNTRGWRGSAFGESSTSKWLVNPYTNAKFSERDTTHIRRFAAIKSVPIKNIMPFFVEVIEPGNRIVTSDGRQFDIATLIHWHNTRDYRGSELGESHNAKWLLNPLTNNIFSEEDAAHIKRFAAEKRIPIKDLGDKESEQCIARQQSSPAPASAGASGSLSPEGVAADPRIEITWPQIPRSLALDDDNGLFAHFSYIDPVSGQGSIEHQMFEEVADSVNRGSESPLPRFPLTSPSEAISLSSSYEDNPMAFVNAYLAASSSQTSSGSPSTLPWPEGVAADPQVEIIWPQSSPLSETYSRLISSRLLEIVPARDSKSTNIVPEGKRIVPEGKYHSTYRPDPSLNSAQEKALRWLGRLGLTVNHLRGKSWFMMTAHVEVLMCLMTRSENPLGPDAAMALLDGLSNFQAQGIAAGLGRADVEGLNFDQVNALIDLRDRGLTAEQLRGQDWFRTGHHQEALVHLMTRPENPLSATAAMMELYGLGWSQAQRIASGLSREQVLQPVSVVERVFSILDGTHQSSLLSSTAAALGRSDASEDVLYEEFRGSADRTIGVEIILPSAPASSLEAKSTAGGLPGRTGRNRQLHSMESTMTEDSGEDVNPFSAIPMSFVPLRYSSVFGAHDGVSIARETNTNPSVESDRKVNAILRAHSSALSSSSFFSRMTARHAAPGGLNFFQEQGIAAGLSRADVEGLDCHQIDALTQLRARGLTADHLRGQDWFNMNDHRNALVHLMTRPENPLNATAAMAELNGLDFAQAGGIANGLSRTDVEGLEVFQIDALIKLRNLGLTAGHLRGQNWFSMHHHRDALIHLMTRPENPLNATAAMTELRGLSFCQVRVIASRLSGEPIMQPVSESVSVSPRF